MSTKGRTLSCVAVTALLVAGALLAGCGGDDDEISKAQFIAKADAICAKAEKEIEDAADEAFANQLPSEQEIKDFVQQTFAPVTEQELADIRDLGAPSGDEDQVDAMLSAAEEATDRAKNDPGVFEEDADPFAKANRLAQAYGLKECGSD